MGILETTIGKLALTAAIAMIPVVELRGAIPAGIAAGLSPLAACAAAIVGNLIPVPMIVLLVRQLFDWLKKSPALKEKIERIEKRAHLKGRVVRKYRLWGLVLLVAIPLPGTGAWTGALVAALFDIRLKSALLATLLGLIIAAAITTAVTLGVIHFL